MRIPIPVIAALALLPAASSCQTKTEISQTGQPRFEADIPGGVPLRLHIRSGEIHIQPGDDNKISVQLSGNNVGKIQDVKMRLTRSDSANELRISGGPKNDLEITVSVPKNSDLFVRIPAGEVHIEGITGNKDVELHAGELIIAVGNPADYDRVDASVTAGEVDGDPFGQSKGGLFRSFRQQGGGKYRLHAHVGAGQLTLQ